MTYFDSEEWMRMWRGVHPVSGSRIGQQGVPRFARRLQHALRKAGSSAVILGELTGDQRGVAGDAAKTGVDSGIRRTD